MAIQPRHADQRRTRGTAGRARPTGAGLAAALAMAALLLPAHGLDLAPPAGATHLESPGPTSLPNWRTGSAAVWDGKHAYVLGGLTGWGATTSEILRYDPATRALAPMNSRLPQAAAFLGAVWTGQHAFVFLPGGTIARFDPALDRVDVMRGTFPGRTSTQTVAWDGNHAYLFGGSLCFNGLHDILRYDPRRDVVETMAATAPVAPNPDRTGWGYSRGAAVSDGRYVYVIGGDVAETWGNSCGVTATQRILRYDPRADVLEPWNTLESLLDLHPYLLRAPIPSQSGTIPVAFDGRHAWIFHGDQVMTTNPALCDRPFPFWAGMWQCPAPPILYDTRDNRLWMHCHSLPRVDASAVWAGDQVLVFSGRQGTNTFHPARGWMMPPAWDAPNLIFHHDRKCAPVPLIAPAAPVECEDRHGRLVADGRRSYDPDGDAFTASWSAPGGTFDDPAGLAPTARLPFGTTPTRLTLRDSRGLEGHATREFQVVDTLPPAAQVVRPQSGYAYVMDVAEAMHGGHAEGRDIVAVGPLTVVGGGEDRCGLGQVRFHASDGSSGTDDEEPFTFRLDPSAQHLLKMKGEVRIRVSAVDLGGNSDATVVDLLHLGTAAPCLRLAPGAVCEGLPLLRED